MQKQMLPHKKNTNLLRIPLSFPSKKIPKYITKIKNKIIKNVSSSRNIIKFLSIVLRVYPKPRTSPNEKYNCCCCKRYSFIKSISCKEDR